MHRQQLSLWSQFMQSFPFWLLLFFCSSQIKKRDPSFAPQSLLDFGSGLGTVAWWAWKHQDSKKETCYVSRQTENVWGVFPTGHHTRAGAILWRRWCVWTAPGQWISWQSDFSKVHTQTLLSVLFGLFSKALVHYCNCLLVFFTIGDEERAEPHIKQVYFRQFLPVSPKVQTFLMFKFQNTDILRSIW